MIEYKPSNPVAVTKEKVIIGGKEYGEMETRTDPTRKPYYYHVFFGSIILSGTGDTREEAISKAVPKARQAAQEILAAADELEAVIAGFTPLVDVVEVVK